jgi:hypothetical protein
MSFKRNNTNTKTNNVAKPFCKVCFDAKRDGYDTHFIRESTAPGAKVVCPYLLSIECQYCKKNGHTVSYCDVLKAQTQTQTQKNKKKTNVDEDGWTFSGNGNCLIIRADELKETKAATRKLVNKFTQLMEVDDDKLDEAIALANDLSNDFPTLNRNSTSTPAPALWGWAKVAAAPRPMKPVPAPAPAQVLKKPTIQIPPPPMVTSFNWADDSDSESD